MSAVALYCPEPGGEPTIRQLVAAYLADQATELLPATLKDRAHLGALFVERFGDVHPSKLRPSEVKAFLLGQPTWRSANTRRKALRGLRRVFEWAVDDRWIAFNPVKKLAMPAGLCRRATTEDELQGLLRVASAVFRRFLVFLRATGARPGEAAAARWEWLDPVRPILVIPPAHHKTGRKTGKPRTVPITRTAQMLLRWLRTRVLVPAGPILLNSRGRPWTRSALGQQLAAGRAAAGLPREVTLHGLRHLFGTTGIERGATLKGIGTALGHNAQATTEGYVHVDVDVPFIVREAELGAHREGQRMLRKCPFTGCDVRIRPSLFACPRHWRILTPAQQTRVYDVYRQWQAGTISGDELRAAQELVVYAAEGGK